MAESHEAIYQALNDEQRDAEARILKFLDDLGVDYTLRRHPPLFTVEDSQELRGELSGLHIKNMFMKDKKGGLWLVSCLEDRKIRIKHLEKALGAPRMSFGKPEILWESLGVRPGAVTPLAMIADREARKVRVVFDAAFEADALVNCHPLHNQATVALRTGDLRRFAEACGHRIAFVDFDGLERVSAEG